MNGRWRVLVGLVFLWVWTGQASLSAAVDDIRVVDGARRWDFIAVNGKSWLPLGYMKSGEEAEKFESVSLPRFWIAERTITEAEFADVMGRSVRAGRTGDEPVAEIEWDDAVAFCRKFTERYSAQFPAKTVASLPAMLEWAHAVRVLEGRFKPCADVGTFLYTGNAYGGYLSTAWKGARLQPSSEGGSGRLAWTFNAVPKRRKSDVIGIRPVLVDLTQEMLGEHPIVSRGIVALKHGCLDEARYQLELATARGVLSTRALELAEHALARAKQDHDVDLEDWSGLVARSARFADSRGYETEPYASAWQLQGWNEMSHRGCAAAYRKAHVDGGWLPVADLPRDLRADQIAAPTTLVQVVACDFSGDRRRDLVVERYGAVGSDGYWYDFYLHRPDGSYTNVHHVQTVGLCVLPGKTGGACGFLTVARHSNPVLAVSLLSYADGRMSSVPANDKPFGMLDTDPTKIYRSAPFIGGGGDRGWRVLEERGVWYRPLYWPWKPGCTPVSPRP